MSYDLMVFKKNAAPIDRAEFMEWYSIQTLWQETHGYNDPVNTTLELRNWFMEMIEHFPAMNGPFRKNNNDDMDIGADYTIGSDIIYVTFPWSLAERAYSLTRQLAQKHNVGFFDVSAEDGDVIR